MSTHPPGPLTFAGDQPGSNPKALTPSCCGRCPIPSSLLTTRTVDSADQVPASTAASGTRHALPLPVNTASAALRPSGPLLFAVRGACARSEKIAHLQCERASWCCCYRNASRCDRGAAARICIDGHGRARAHLHVHHAYEICPWSSHAECACMLHGNAHYMGMYMHMYMYMYMLYMYSMCTSLLMRTCEHMRHWEAHARSARGNTPTAPLLCLARGCDPLPYQYLLRGGAPRCSLSLISSHCSTGNVEVTAGGSVGSAGSAGPTSRCCCDAPQRGVRRSGGWRGLPEQESSPRPLR